MTTTLGWWVLPALVTIVGLIWVQIEIRKESRSGPDAGIISLFLHLMWMVASLASWVAYFAYRAFA